jgi:hypothetical protein
MSNSMLHRFGAASGAIFAIVLFVAPGNGSNPFSAIRVIAGLTAITMAVPFLGYPCSLLRSAEGEGGWIATTAFASGLAGITLKLSSGGPLIAEHKAGIATGTPLHKALEGIADGVTLISLYPLALFSAGVAIVALRRHALPRSLGAGWALTAVALAVNGCFVTADFVPGLLLFIVWTLVTSLYLTRRAWRQPSTGRLPAPAGA